MQWLILVKERDLAYSLDYAEINDVIDTFSRINALNDLVPLIEKAKAAKDMIFKGYSDAQPMKEFVRRNQKLDLNTDFQNANHSIPLRLIVINEELRRHLRNLEK